MTGPPVARGKAYIDNIEIRSGSSGGTTPHTDVKGQVLFSDDFSSGNLNKWTLKVEGGGSEYSNCQSAPWPCNLEIENGALKLVAIQGGNYSVQVIKNIFPTQNYAKYVLSFDWKATVKETPWGVTEVSAHFYNSADERIAIMTALNTGFPNRPFEDHGGNLVPGRYGGEFKVHESFDWERVTLDTTTAVPLLNMTDVHRIHLKATVYNDAGSGGDLYVDNLSFVGASSTTRPPDEEPEPEPDTPTPEATTDATVSITPTSVASPAIGQKLEFRLNITGGKAVAGYQASVQFDTTALRFVSGANGTYLPAGAFFVKPKVEGNLVRLNAASIAGESNGDGTLTTLTFEVIDVKVSTLTLSDVLLSNSAGVTFVPHVENAEITESTRLKEDVNGDGVVNIADLVLVAGALNKTGQKDADVNGDGVVNIADLVLVAGALNTSAAAPSLGASTLINPHSSGCRTVVISSTAVKLNG